MSFRFRELNTIDRDIINQIIKIEQAAFGKGGMNEWFLLPFIRYGKVYILTYLHQVLAVAEYIRDFSKPKRAYLFGLVVKIEYRHQGLGQKLLEQAHYSLKQDGISDICLTVDPTNKAALRLYSRLGFSKGEFLSNEYGKNEDRLVLNLKL